MSKLRKFVPKRFHFSRYYTMGVWMAILAKVEAEEAAVAAATTALGTAAVPIEVDGSETAAAAGEARTEAAAAAGNVAVDMAFRTTNLTS